jgi:hypothetical protein
LLSDTVIVKNIEIQKPEIYFEQKMSGSNLDALKSNLGGGSPKSTCLVVDHLLVKRGQVTLSTDIGGEKSVKAEFDRIELSGIGRDGSNTMEQTMRQVLEPILEKAARQAIKQGLLEQAKGKLKELLDG